MKRRAQRSWWEWGLILSVMGVSAALVFWFALVHTIHLGTQTVPDLGGRTVAEARRIAHDRGLNVEPEKPGVYSTTVPVGAIARQEPRPGFHVKSGATIRVRLSLGGERVEVPAVAGESLQGAVGVLEQVGLRPGRRVQVAGMAEGDSVIATDPPIGTPVPPETSVDILLNQIPKRSLWVMPSLLEWNVDRVRAFCSRNRFRLGQIHRVVYPGVASGQVLRQYPPAGSPLSTSDIITVWASQ